jgi:hypothetical protein
MAVGRRPRERRAGTGLVARVALVALVGAVTTGWLVLEATPAAAAQQISVNPSSGPKGSTFKLTPSGWPVGVNCNSLTYIWDLRGTYQQTLATGQSTTATFTTKVPNVPVGTYPIQASCMLVTGAQITATTRFTVTVTSTTSTTVKTTTTTTKKGSTTTTAKKGTPTTTGQPGSSTSSTAPGGSTTTTTAKPGTHHKKKITIIASPGDSPGATSTSYLQLDALAISPGAAITAAGRGCDHGSPVTLTIGSTQVGETTAGGDGTFHAPLDVKDLSVGRYDVQAACGAILTASFDVVLASRVDPGTSTTMVIIVFFILIGVVAFRRRLFPSRYPARVKSSGASVEDEV